MVVALTGVSPVPDRLQPPHPSRGARPTRSRRLRSTKSRPGCQGLRRRAGDGSSAEAMQARKTSAALLMRMQATAAAAKMVRLNDAAAKEYKRGM